MRFFKIPSCVQISSIASTIPFLIDAPGIRVLSTVSAVTRTCQSGSKPSRSTPLLTSFTPHHPPNAFKSTEISPQKRKARKSDECSHLVLLHLKAVWASYTLLRVVHYFRCRCCMYITGAGQAVGLRRCGLSVHNTTPATARHDMEMPVDSTRTECTF
jgi:hypothetical protein